MQAGLDSLGAVQLHTALADRFGMALPPAALFNYPTASGIARYIMARLHASPQGRATQSTVSGSMPGMQRLAPVHVVDVSSQYPEAAAAGMTLAQSPKLHRQM
jgi:polyketide synthase 12